MTSLPSTTGSEASPSGDSKVTIAPGTWNQSSGSKSADDSSAPDKQRIVTRPLGCSGQGRLIATESRPSPSALNRTSLIVGGAGAVEDEVPSVSIVTRTLPLAPSKA